MFPACLFSEREDYQAPYAPVLTSPRVQPLQPPPPTQTTLNVKATPIVSVGVMPPHMLPPYISPNPILNPEHINIGPQSIFNQSFKDTQSPYFPFRDAPQFLNVQAQRIAPGSTAMHRINTAQFQQMLSNVGSFSTQLENNVMHPEKQSMGLITLAEIARKNEIMNLISPEAKLLDTLGISRHERLFAPPIIQVNPNDSLPTVSAKIDIACARVEQNKDFLKNTFDTLAPGIVNFPSSQSLSFVDKSTSYLPTSLDGYTPKEKREYLRKKVVFFEQEEKELKIAEGKYAILAQNSSEVDEISTVPITGDNKSLLQAFKQGAEDQEKMSELTKRALLSAGGLSDDYCRDYLTQNFKGPPKGVGSNLFYFAGSMAKLTQQGLQTFATFLDPNTKEAVEIQTIGAGTYLAKKELMNALPENIRDSLDILTLADEKNMAILASAKNGQDKDQLLQDMFIATYSTALTGEPASHFKTWDNKLGQSTKGVLHETFDFFQRPYRMVQAIGFSTGIDSLEDLLDAGQRQELHAQLNGKIQNQTVATNNFVQKILGINPFDPSYLSARAYANSVPKIASLIATPLGILGNLTKLNRVSGPVRLSSIALKNPSRFNSILENYLIQSKDRITYFKVDKSHFAKVAYPSQIKVFSQYRLNLQKQFLGDVNLASTRQASRLLHRAAEINLSEWRRKILPEAQIRKYINQTGIPTFARPKEIPGNFRVRITKDGAGMEYLHPNHNHTAIRIMPGKPHSPNPCQQKPYVVQKINGDYFDKCGNLVRGSAPEAHIPFDQFIYRGE